MLLPPKKQETANEEELTNEKLIEKFLEPKVTETKSIKVEAL